MPKKSRERTSAEIQARSFVRALRGIPAGVEFDLHTLEGMMSGDRDHSESLRLAVSYRWIANVTGKADTYRRLRNRDFRTLEYDLAGVLEKDGGRLS